VKNSKIILKSNHDPFSDGSIEEWFVKNMPYEKIVLWGKGCVSRGIISVISE
jgi:CRISPR-associated protein Cas1